MLPRPDFMMKLVRFTYPDKVFMPASKSPESLVYKPIVHDKINNPVKDNAKSGKKKISRMMPVCKNQINSKKTKANCKQIIPFKKGFFLLMMAFMQEPKWPVKEIFMYKPRDALHHYEGKKHDEYVQQSRQHFIFY